MRSGIALAIGAVFFGLSLSARADMIETKGRGVINGKIISQDDKEVRFEDSAKNLFIVPKKDVLFLEAQTDRLATAQTNNKKGRDWGLEIEHWKYKAERLFYDVKSFVSEKTLSIRKYIEKPLDRNAADSRSEALAKSMGDLSTTLKVLNKQDRKRAVRLREISEDQMHASIKTKNKNNGTGTFSSLE